MLFLHLVLRHLLVLNGGIQQLLGIVLTHLRLLLLLLLFVVFLIFVLIFLIVLLLVVFLLIVLIVLILLLILILLLFLTLTEHQVVARFIVIRIQAQGILVGLDSLTIHLVRLANHTHVMIGSRLAQRVGLDAGSLLKLLHSGRVLLLGHQRITQVISSLRILGIFFYGLTIRHLGLIILSHAELLVTLADILAVGLCAGSHSHQQQQHRSHLLLRAKERQALEQRTATVVDTYLEDEQQQCQDSHSLELLVKLTVNSAGSFLLREFVEFVIQLVLCRTVVLHMDIGTATSLSHLATHILVESRHHGIARVILHIIACARNGDRRTLSRSYTQHIHAHACFFGSLGSFECPTLVVLTIGNHDNGLTNTFFLCKAMRSHIDGTSNICALSGHHRWVDTRQEHLGRYIVAGDRQLHKGIACKHYQTYLIVGKMIHQVLDHHLTAVQTTWHDILGQHRVTDIHGDNRLDTHTLLVTDLGTELRTCQHHYQQCQSSLQHPEFDCRTETRHIGHQRAQQLGIAKLTQAFLLIAIREKADERQYWYHR